MMPIVDGLEADFEGNVAVFRLTADQAENARLQAQYGLRGHPSFAVVDGHGRISQTFVGPQTAETLRAAMAAVVDDG
ncbi:MAG TPA: hypothetical protein VF177_08740 [Anaerolineae bacterium]